MPEFRETISSLYRLTRFPVEYRDEVFALYPALKLGVRESTVHYAKRLAPLAEALIASRPRSTDWALTAPPYQAIPAAANLLSLEIFDLLKDRLATTVKLSLARITEESERLEDDSAPIDYSQLNSRQRSASRERSASFLLHHDGLCGRDVIFVNDINVTGAQQLVMRRYFETVKASATHWLYIIDVEKSLGKQSPEIEYAINNSRLSTFEELANLLATEELEFTSKCVARIFSYDLARLTQLFGMLPQRRRSRILELVTQDARYANGYFKPKIDLLTALCSRDRHPADRP